MKNAELSSIVPLQHSLRDYLKVGKFVKLLKEHGSGIFKDAPPLQLVHLTDTSGKILLHDGHHRCTAYVLSGCDVPDDQIQFTEYKSYEYNEINYERKWVTPLNPFGHARRADVSIWWSVVFKLMDGGTDEETLTKFIRSNVHLYTIPKLIHTMLEFSQQYVDLVELDCI